MSQHRRKAPRNDARRHAGGSASGAEERNYGGREHRDRGYGQGGYGSGGSSRGDSPGGQYGGGYGGDRGYGAPGGRDTLGPSTRTYGRAGDGGVRPQDPGRPRTRAEARAAGRGGAGGGYGDGPGGGKKRFIDYPRAGKTGLRRWMPSAWQVTGIFATGFAFLFGAAAVAYTMIDIPDPNASVNYQTSIFSYDDGNSEFARLFSEQRTKVELGTEIKPEVQNAVLAAENRTFFTDSGISPRGIARAAWTNARGGSTQGGSTITQQLAKNMYLSQERTVSRKAKEFFIAIKLDQQRDKQQILEDYLNTIYFGRGAHGIEAAAQVYYGEKAHASNLSVAQAAALAAMIRGPRFYDPYQGEGNEARLQARFRYVLDGMVKMGAISPAQAAATQYLKPLPPRKQNRFAQQKGYMVEDVKRELRSLVAQGAVEPEVYDNLETGGYKIKTTFNKNAMLKAQQAVDNVMKQNKELQKLKGVRIGLAAVKPGTGQVVATYGGADYLKTAESNATVAQSQPGSTFKAFALAAAFRREEPILLESRFAGISPWRIPNTAEGEAGAEIRNEQNTSYAKFVDLLTATKLSINTAFVDLTLKVGPENVRQAAVDAGIPETKDLKANTNARIPLGIHAVRVLDIANGYATFAAEGVAAKPYVIQEIRDANDKPIYRHKAKPKQVFEKDVVSNIDFALEQVITGTPEFGDEPTGRRAKALSVPAAGKTGTAETACNKAPGADSKACKAVNGTNTTAWFVGYTPNLSTAVAMFRDLPTQPLDSDRLVFGGQYPTEIWTEFMRAALEGVEAKPFPERVKLENGERINPAPSTPKVVSPPQIQKPGKKRGPNSDPTFTIPPIPDPTFTPDPPPSTCEPPFCFPTSEPTRTRTRKPFPPPEG